MAWIYLAASEGLPLLSPLGSDQLPTVRSIDTPMPFCSRDRPMERCTAPQFGMTCVHCAALSFHQWTSSPPDSHARTSALRVVGLAWVESKADWLARSFDLPERSNPSSFSLKTCQRLGPAAENEWSRSWPASGMTVDGICYRLMTWARPTREHVGFYWPTARANDAKSHRNKTVKNRKGPGHSGTTLTDFVTLWPTPSASQYGSNKGGAAGRVGMARPSLNTMHGGKLNPTWVEWLMNFPTEWTVCAPWAMPSSRSKRAQRSKD